MTAPTLSADDVAAFLQQHPDFFQDHADLFANLQVPHPHATHAISLGERQILALRAKAKDLEWKLSGLMHNASGNEKIARTVTDWCAHMLAEDQATQLPAAIVQGLQHLFDLPDVALRLWGLPGLPADHDWLLHPDDAQVQACQELTLPYCGPFHNRAPVQWLDTPPASVALVALHAGPDGPLCGVLAIGSDDPARFTDDMGTAFLETLGRLASAALGRLASQAS